MCWIWVEGEVGEDCEGGSFFFLEVRTEGLELLQDWILMETMWKGWQKNNRCIFKRF